MQSASDITASNRLPARLPKGYVVGDYVVDGWVRDGGMAAIYRAVRSADGARVALKLQLPSTAHRPEICERFDREAEAMRRISGGPNVIELLHADMLEDGRRYFVMEWINGEDLDELLDFRRNQDQRLSISQACRIGRDIATGLATVHDHQLVHRDLKPANVMIGEDEGGAEVVKLVDFGIVADLRLDARAGLRAEEEIMGTSAYMAPEQVAGEPPAPQIDLFALGVVLYEALTGSCVPPDGWTPESLPSIESLRRGVPPRLVELVRACMGSDPHQRPGSAAAVAQQLHDILREHESAKSGRAPAREVPIRTGGTVVTPRAEVEALEQAIVRTGGTEVALTHQEVMSTTGTIPTLVAADGQETARGAGSTGKAAASVGAGSSAKGGPAADGERSARGKGSVGRKDASKPGAEKKTRPGSGLGVAARPVAKAEVGQPVGFPPSMASTHGASTHGASAHGASAHSVAEGAPAESTSRGRASSAPSMTSSGGVPLASLMPSGPSPIQTMPRERAADSGEFELEKGRKWLVLLALLPILGGVGWWVIGRNDGEGASEAVAVAKASDSEDPEAPVEIEDTEPEQQAERPVEPVEPDSEGDDALVLEGEAESEGEADPPAEPPDKRESSKPDGKGRSKGPNKAACEAKRAEANSAKTSRKWSGVLKATSQRACWAGALKLERRRLRVEAHAELGNFAKCTKEGGRSKDKEISARVKWCEKKLG